MKQLDLSVVVVLNINLKFNLLWCFLCSLCQRLYSKGNQKKLASNGNDLRAEDTIFPGNCNLAMPSYVLEGRVCAAV
jgi:hypothetical protein